MKLAAENRIKLDEGITRHEINGLVKEPCLASEPHFALPQANDFNRVVAVLEYMKDQPVTANEVSMHQGFSRRQADYYLDALIYLSLVEKAEKGVYKLTDFGVAINSLKTKQKCLRLAKEILIHPAFRRFFNECASQEVIKTRADAIRMLKESGYSVDDTSTFQRRAGTVRCWVIWIYSLAWDIQMDYA